MSCFCLLVHLQFVKVHFSVPVLLLVLLQVNVCFFSSTDSIFTVTSSVHVYLIQLCGVGLHNTKVDIVILTLIFLIYIWLS